MFSMPTCLVCGTEDAKKRVMLDEMYKTLPDSPVKSSYTTHPTPWFCDDCKAVVLKLREAALAL